MTLKRPLSKWVASLLMGVGMASVAAEPTAETVSMDADAGVQPWTGSLEAWIHATRTAPNDSSPINPRNQVVQIPERQWQAEMRLNARGDFEPFDVVADLRLIAEHDTLRRGSVVGGQDRTQEHTEAQLIQGFGRWKVGDTTTVVGRELLAWGPATFRSPSNPFYFDAGLTQPLAVTPGVDLVRVTHSINEWRLTAAHVVSSDRLEPAVDRSHTSVLKLDHQGQAHLVSVNLAAKAHQKLFAGAFVQYVPDDAWLVYAEHGAANSAAGLGRTSLGGASYTLHSGQMLTAEWLHHAGGWQRAQSHQYFAQAAQAIALGSPMGNVSVPRQMGRNYLWLGLQSNPQHTQFLWRSEWVRNQTDASSRWMVYVEKSFNASLSGFLMVRRHAGGGSTEFGSLVKHSATVGIKLFL